MDLTPRLRCVASLVPREARLADVGTDHGYLPVLLLREGRIRSAIAADLRSGPLDRARQTALRYGLEDAISFRLCDGLSGIQAHEADTIVIAGMGGETIAGILEHCPWADGGAHLFLLQPMSSLPDLRVRLGALGFCILREVLVSEGKKYYVVLAVQAGPMPPLTLGEQWAGRQTPGMVQPLRGAYLTQLLERLDRALAGMVRGDAASAPELARLRETGRQLSDMKEEWEQWQR
ncbi:hypothetical protein SDC9_99871 [bioreactor metagenome]|uniref:Uncharacterized protein n=1 Tax=bioreactor metagenome TaxID=1076179 RepID=A0A645AJB1_9ZZZZ